MRFASKHQRIKVKKFLYLKKEKLVKMKGVTTCGACEAPATLVCGGCGDISYCSKECQKSHWKSGHKSSCKAFKIEIHPEQAQYIHLDSTLSPQVPNKRVYPLI